MSHDVGVGDDVDAGARCGVSDVAVDAVNVPASVDVALQYMDDDVGVVHYVVAIPFVPTAPRLVLLPRAQTRNSNRRTYML